MHSLENRLNRLERKIINTGGNKNIVVLFIDVGETEGDARTRYLRENPHTNLEGCINFIVHYI